MTRHLLYIYDYLKAHRHLRLLLLAVSTLAMLAALSRLRFSEDIAAFLPSDSTYQQQLTAYRHLGGADRLVVIVEDEDTTRNDADRMVAAVDSFRTLLAGRDTLSWTADLRSEIDLDAAETTLATLYSHLPLFLTAADYERIDSLLSRPDYIHNQLEQAEEALLSPFGDLASDNIGRDPLGLFAGISKRLSAMLPTQGYEVYSDHIFSPDMRRAILTLRTTFGASETEGNARLMSLLDEVSNQTMKAVPGTKIHVTGAPAIAVSNAKAIKHDSTIAIGVAVLLILLLLFYSLRNARNIGLIVVSIAWGWLFAMAGLALLRPEVSIIVVGIASVIIGIAVNYPLHLIAHLNHRPDARSALGEIVEPLTTGNITTVGAFMALIPLPSQALRDLGIFASLLLLGTILFTLIFLPHLVSTSAAQRPPHLLAKLGDWQPERRRWIVPVVALFSVVLALFSTKTGFDSDMSHLNYMTPEQQADMEALARQGKGARGIMLLSSGTSLDEALRKSRGERQQAQQTAAMTAPMSLPDMEEQKARLQLWQRFTDKYAATLRRQLAAEGASIGFTDDSFADFLSLLSCQYATVPPERLLKELPMMGTTVYQEGGNWQVVSLMKPLSESHTGESISRLKDKKISVIDPAELNSKVAETLNGNFNYIGLVCSFIVFLFLWFSMGSLELAAISFLPMAVSWLWILGLMGLTGMEFNMVNVILATFIFGQGDDYTIFITEGCEYEYARGRRLLGSFKQSIIISALIMFIGIGTLIFARHPALRSLAQVTIVGMFSVVLMAWLLPPYIFRRMTTHGDGQPRLRPLTLRNLLRGTRVPATGKAADYHHLVLDRYRYKGRDILGRVSRNLKAQGDYAAIADEEFTAERVAMTHAALGDCALMLALVHKDLSIDAYCDNEDSLLIARRAAEGLARNLRFHLMSEWKGEAEGTKTIDLNTILKQI